MEKVLQFLNNCGIPYQLYRHEAVVSVSDSMRIINLPYARGYKSLFVKDKKSDRYFMAVISSESRADMRALASYVGSAKFEFGTAEKMMQYLHVCRGCVSPFCFVYPSSAEVGLLLEPSVVQEGYIRFHPCDNTATVVLTSADFLRFLAALGKKYILTD